MAVKRLENHTDQLIDLPPIHGIEGDDGNLIDFPEGIRLQPGLNTVPQLYLDALHAQVRQVYDQLGRPRMAKPIKGQEAKPLLRYPGREAIAGLIAPVTYSTANGMRHGPRVTIFEPEQVADREDGPTAPATLPASENAALAIISVTDDRKALDRWMKQSKSPNIKVACQSKMASLAAKAT